LFYRWTFVGEPTWPVRVKDERSRWWLPRSWPVKLMVHRFLGNADDRDVHDHPRPFVTFVLRGGYDDLKPCPDCEGAERVDDPVLLALYRSQGGLRITDPDNEDLIARWQCWMPCPTCETPERGPIGVVLNERMRAGMVRFRPAEHRHRTKVHPDGAWTLVIMGPVRRRWGFWKNGRWWFWKDYEAEFGFGMRCEPPRPGGGGELPSSHLEVDV
jgi:hypothetical protein